MGYFIFEPELGFAAWAGICPNERMENFASKGVYPVGYQGPLSATGRAWKD